MKYAKPLHLMQPGGVLSRRGEKFTQRCSAFLPFFWPASDYSGCACFCDAAHSHH